MPESLAQRHCVECRPGTPPLPADRAAHLLAQLDGWQLGSIEGHPTLTKTLEFKGFMPGVDLVNRIAELAEAEGHHPDLRLAYGKLRVDLWTHTAGGLTENDFILAAKIDHIRPS